MLLSCIQLFSCSMLVIIELHRIPLSSRMICGQILIFLALFLIVSSAEEATNCDRTCGEAEKGVPYPFGFSEGCDIKLSCSENDGTIYIGDFEVQNLTSGRILLSVPRKCNRSIDSLNPLFGSNFALTGRNGLLLRNCSPAIDDFTIPSSLFNSIFKFGTCDLGVGNSSGNIYYNQNQSIDGATNDTYVAFLNRDRIRRGHCSFLFSSILVDLNMNESDPLLISERLKQEKVELGWWMLGSCNCDPNANCIPVIGKGFRCTCREGYTGDGFARGEGCRTAKSKVVQIALLTGVAVAVVAFSIILFVLARRKYMLKGNMQNNHNIELLLKKHGNLALRRYKYSNLKKITNSFSDKLGEGGFASVYRGNLPEGHVVAVKILKESKGNGEEFINEVVSISRTSHINIVSLLGFCFEGSKRALIYEFMPNGSLEKFIYSNCSLPKRQLGWEKLLQIAVGIARGMEYLHQGCNIRILHFDIKPHNILLDKEFNPKISDFGLAKLCPNRSSIVSILGARGTIGYIAPELVCRNIGEVSHKSDVYSYGMMVLEMVGERKNIDIGVDRTSEIYFPHWIYKHLERNVELNLDGVSQEDEQLIVRKMIIIGLWCIQTDPTIRPPMTKVVEMLEGNIESLQIPPKPYLSSPPRQEQTSSTSQSALASLLLI